MSDTEKIKVIDKIIAKAFEYEPIRDSKTGYYEGIISAILGVIGEGTEDAVNV